MSQRDPKTGRFSPSGKCMVKIDANEVSAAIAYLVGEARSNDKAAIAYLVGEVLQERAARSNDKIESFCYGVMFSAVILVMELSALWSFQ